MAKSHYAPPQHTVHTCGRQPRGPGSGGSHGRPCSLGKNKGTRQLFGKFFYTLLKFKFRFHQVYLVYEHAACVMKPTLK